MLTGTYRTVSTVAASQSAERLVLTLSLIMSEHRPMIRLPHRLGIPATALFATTFVAFAFIAFAFSPAQAAAIDEPAQPVVAPPADKKPAEKAGDQATDAKKPDAKPADTRPAGDKKSDNNFRDGYKRAYALIYTEKDYRAGIAVLRALGQDNHPDVANLIGFSSRKLGRVDDAKLWYEAALAADPRHTRTLQYYGMWHLEQGNRLKAEDHLESIRLICGQGCEDFRSLQQALDGNSTY